jgi:hypothetical protein
MMSNREPITWEGREYPTYAALRADVVAFLERYRHHLGDLDAEGRDRLVGLIRERHPDADKKLARPVVAVRHELRKGRNQLHMVLVYGEGDTEAVSWVSCCRKATPQAVTALAAMRHAVQRQISFALSMAFAGSPVTACRRTGRLIFMPMPGREAPVVNGFTAMPCDVHHAGPTFRELVDQWLQQQCLTLDDIPTVWLKGKGGGAGFREGELRNRWYRFHNAHAVLEVVDREWHRKHATREAACT